MCPSEVSWLLSNLRPIKGRWERRCFLDEYVSAVIRVKMIEVSQLLLSAGLAGV